MSAPESVEFSIDETIEILRPALPDDSLVLVGGQAVNYWLAHYREREPALGALAGVASSDVDFLGSRESIERIAAAIRGSTVKFEEPREPTVALIRFTDRNGQERIIDFLRTVYGLDEKRVRDTAIPVETRDASGAPSGVELRILHPILCLESRVYNVHGLEKYQTPRALKQLEAAVGCARAYIRECCDRGDTRGAHRAVQVIADLASGDAGRGIFALHQIDPLEAIPNDRRLGESFFSENLPRIRQRAGRK